ncbi:lithostathine-1-like isoform X2 [Dendroctonus ponderosae]|uniref:lithostathine-1-like isoform X2 n=1 Tax=Dendroctonus ponderosae TaxID=77166 RepID=UPI002035E79B|nr:lithostathine-1-like isoform X2 [Dendroctonus ponderosae]KAH1015093.1 hypothetical protein HUJ05_012871 [Dendroctonus ponderosae]
MSKPINFVFALLLCALSVRCSGLTRIGGSKYYVSSDEHTYVEADLACQMEDNMKLAAFETEEEYLQFNETMNNWGISNTESYWLGGLRLKNGLWYWTSSKKRFDYSTWSSNEPNCGSIVVCCLLMGKSTTEARNWQAANCCTEHLYICEV